MQRWTQNTQGLCGAERLGVCDHHHHTNHPYPGWFINSQLNPRAGSLCWRQNRPHWALLVTSSFPAVYVFDPSVSHSSQAEIVPTEGKPATIFTGISMFCQNLTIIIHVGAGKGFSWLIQLWKTCPKMPERNQGDVIRSEKSILGTPDWGRKG